MYYTRLRLTSAFQNGNKGLIQKEKLVLSRVQHLQFALLHYLVRLFGAITAPLAFLQRAFCLPNFHSEGGRLEKTFRRNLRRSRRNIDVSDKRRFSKWIECPFDQSSLAASSTASTWPGTFTLRHALTMVPSLSIRNVDRSTPIYLRPYMLFSTHTP